MHRRVPLALASLALAAAPARAADPGADEGVVVIRGSNVSVARPLTPERARDGSAEVEIVRVAAPAEPAARPRPPAPERELVVVVLPAEEPPPLGIPVAFAPAWPWAWNPSFHHRGHVGPRGHFPPTFHPLGIHRGPLRNAMHRR